MITRCPFLRLRMGAILLVLTNVCTAQTIQDTTISYQYDANGNLTQITDPLGHVTNQSYDALNRLRQKLQPAPSTGGSRPAIHYSYDGLDQLVSVTDPRNLTTAYTVDGLGNQTALASPDTGTTTKTYDEAGNLKTSTDAKGQTTSYQYDVLNRITGITYADGNTASFNYDQGPNGIGRLTQIVDNSGNIQYAHDKHGRIVGETRTIDNAAYVTGYSYDSAGRLASMTYPGGRTVTYSRDAMGRISQIDTTKDGATQTLVSQATYHPLHGVKAFLNGANVMVTRSIDLDGRTIGYTLASSMQAVVYDAASRINNITDTVNVAASQTYGYDNLDRLVSYSGSGGSQSLSYDAVGNRSSQTIGTAVNTYSYHASANRLTQISGGSNKTYQYDANGSTTNNGSSQFSYDARGRLVSATTAQGVVQYRINALGQRVQKTVAGVSTVFHYDTNGRLIGESTGQDGKDYVYLDDLPVAVLQ